MVPSRPFNLNTEPNFKEDKDSCFENLMYIKSNLNTEPNFKEGKDSCFENLM